MKNFIGFLTSLLLLSVAYSQSSTLTVLSKKNPNESLFGPNTIGVREDNGFSPRTNYAPLQPPTDSVNYSSATTFCSGGGLTLTAKYAPSNATYQWTKDSVAINGATASTYTAITSGVYSVIVNDGQTTTNYPSVTITVNPSPKATFSFSPNNSCSNVPVFFTNASTGTGLTYQWNFNDPKSSTNTSSAIRPSHVFVGTPGSNTQSFSVSLIATDINGCADTTAATVTTSQLPDASLGGTGFRTYNNLPYFTQCNASASNFTFTNRTTTNNSNYIIQWGDGSADYTTNNFSTVTHTYNIGNYTIHYIVTGINNCKDTSIYYVFVGNNPAVGLGNPGNTIICSGTALTFPISGTTNNPLGTVYTVSYNDNSPDSVFSHPAPADVTHTFNIGSCGATNNSGFPNSFSASIKASNPCGTSAATVVPIYVSQMPKASFTMSPSSAVCVGGQVKLTNTSPPIKGVGSDGTCSDGNIVWQISPATGWSVSSGSLGNDFGLSDPSSWMAGTDIVNINFITPGTYTIKIKIGGSTLCGTDETTQTICVNPTPVAGFTIDKTQGCSPLTVATTNTSNTPTCGANQYSWAISYSNASGCSQTSPDYSFVNGTNASSAKPQFQFNSPGVYTITLVTKNSNGSCSSSPVSQNITVKAKPNVTLSVTPNICQNSSVHPSASVLNCYATNPVTYAWSFPGGSPSSSTFADPGNISYATPGTYTITLSVTNECGTTTVNKNITVNATPTLTVPSDQSFCPGVGVGAFSFSATPSGSAITWTASTTTIGLSTTSGVGNTPAFTTVNNSSAPISANITVTANNIGCTNQSSFTIKVNPKPPAPVTNAITYCQGASAAPLNATAQGGNTVLWYTQASGGSGSTTAPTPVTFTSGTFNFYVSQVDPTTGCESNRSLLAVTVLASPNIGSATANNTTGCSSSTGSITLTGLNANTSYTVSYTKNGATQTTTLISTNSGILTIPNLSSGTYDNIFVTLNGCSSQSKGPLTISDPSAPATPVVGSVGPLCSGAALNLSVSNSSASMTYHWSGPNGYSANGSSISIPNVSTSASGDYSVTATQNNCSSGSAVVTVQVNPTPPTPNISSNSPLCSDSTLRLSASGVSSGASYAWSGPNSFASTSPNPSLSAITSVASGTYSLVVTQGSCSSKQATAQVQVNPTPKISGKATQPTACSANDGTIVLSGLSSGAYNISFTKDGIVQALANQIVGASGTLALSNLSPATYDHIKVSLSGCPSNEVGPFILSDPTPPAAPIVSSNGPVCSGKQLMLFANSITSGVTYSWNGPNGFTSQQQNPVILSTTNQNNGTYTVTVKAMGCTASTSLDVTINPTPSKPVVVLPSTYCLQSPAAPLSATAAAGNTLTWYDQPNLSTPLPGAPTPSTASAGTFYFYVNQTNTFTCTSDTTAIPILVLPALSGNLIGKDQTICSGGTPDALTPQLTIAGGNGTYSYQWQQFDQGTSSWKDIANALSASYQPGSLTQTSKFRRMVASGPCGGTPSNEVTITVQGVLTSVGIQGDQTICAGSQPTLINGDAPQGGSGLYSYMWEHSQDQQSWQAMATDTTQNLQPAVLNATTYYRRTVYSGSCSATSSVVTISVNPVPVLSGLSDLIYCNGSTASSKTFVASPSSGVDFSWTNDNTAIGLAASGTGNLPSFTTQNNSHVPITGKVQVLPSYSGNGKTCTGNPVSFTITVLPTINIIPKPSDTAVCTGTTLPDYTPSTDAGAFGGSSISYQWSVSGSGISLTGGSGNSIPSFTTSNLGRSDLVANVTIVPQYSLNGKTCDGIPVSYSVTVKPATPKAGAGGDTVLCAATSYTMQATLPSSTTGLWSTLNFGVSIADPSSPTTNISGLKPGQTYRFTWTVRGFATCPPNSTPVAITVDPLLINTIDNQTDSICYGQMTHILGHNPSGGNGAYTYQWQSSLDSITWKDIPGQVNQSLDFTPQQTMWVKRTVQSLPCTEESSPTKIVVQPPVSNNTISADQVLCVSAAADTLSGSTPQGANGAYHYQWLQSTDNGSNWQTIAGADSAYYAPNVLQATTMFKRMVTSSLCSGPQSSSSNTVTITIHPDGQAQFSWGMDTACAPFVLNNAVIHLQVDLVRNSDYLWYANGQLLGSGTSFPGWTLTSSGDSTQIKLVAISRYGCKNDSIAHSFYTRVAPKPSFSLSDSMGCGPLMVLFTNTTPSPGLFTYQWTFGNGQTFNNANPGPVSYTANPTFGDTTYTAVLKASSVCTTLQYQATIRVQSKPKALFAPSSSSGCSPMRVVFHNTSLGLGNHYTWDFGDGTSVSANTTDTISHVFITGVRDTFYVKLKAFNGCGEDSMRYAIVVSPNKIFLDFAFNGNEATGCAPHSVHFITNSKGATLFTWNFGDGTVINSTKNIDTLTHDYLLPGTHNINLEATNGCSDTSTTETIVVYSKPHAAFTVNSYTACLGDSIWLHNTTDSATSYLWQFGDGNVSSDASPVHSYYAPGTYMVVLKSFRFNAPGSVCTDSASATVNIVSSLPGWFEVSDSVGSCAPFTVKFTNPHVPSVSALWDFGDGTKGSGDQLSHTYMQAGVYQVQLTVKVPGGCTYVTTRQITILGPSGNWTYSSGYLCGSEAAFFQVNTAHTDMLIFDFGDGTSLTTTSNQVYHSYQNPGGYLPSVTLKNNSGCAVVLNGTDSIRVDHLQSGFTYSEQQDCGSTTLNVRDSSHVFFGGKTILWNFGDGTTGSGSALSHIYRTSGSYTITQVVEGVSGCADTTIKIIFIRVNNQPKASIATDSVSCVGYLNNLQAFVQSSDTISLLQWTLSTGLTSAQNPFATQFTQAGTYQVRLVVGTNYGCYDTAYQQIRERPSPTVVAGNDQTICRGTSVPLSAQGQGNIISYSWSPLQGLSCKTCATPIVTPLVTTPYVVQATNSVGCSAWDTTVVTVIQPLHINVSSDDSICIGQSTNLLVSGATSYSWSPAAGLSSTTLSNPVATPQLTTRYRVVGYDGYNCFTDTAYVLVGVGAYPTVNLGPDLTLSTGTLQPLKSTITGGPIRDWLWEPNTDLSCSACALPIATIKHNIDYRVKVTNYYGCSTSDTLHINVFCESAQVFIPNAFSPDGDGINDILMVRGKGIVMVKSFRIFNRWGELVFEKSDFTPNDPTYGWDGKIRGVVGGPDVYVYTAEVECENGSVFTYKGNVSIIK